MSDVFSLRALGLGLVAEDGILTAATVGELAAGARIVREAEARAATIIAQAEAAFEAERRRGHAEGLAQAQTEVAAWMYAARQDLDLRLDHIQGELADVVVLCVKRIVHTFDDTALAVGTVRSALASLRSEKRLQLFVSPSVEAAVRAHLPEFLADYPEIALIDLIADPILTAPDVRLESELGVVTSVLDETLEGLGRLLRGAR